MAKHYEVDVVLSARVLVKVEDDEGETEAMQYAADEYSSGDIETQIRRRVYDESEIENRHYDLILTE